MFNIKLYAPAVPIRNEILKKDEDCDLKESECDNQTAIINLQG